MKEKETVKSDAKKEVQQEIKTLQKERDAEIQRIYARYIASFFPKLP